MSECDNDHDKEAACECLSCQKFYGNQYFLGEKGATGAQGPKGDKGDKGDIGATGAAGPVGATGAQGPAGKEGTRVTGAALEYSSSDKSLSVSIANADGSSVTSNKISFPKTLSQNRNSFAFAVEVTSANTGGIRNLPPGIISLQAPFVCVGRYMASVNAPSPTRVAGQNNSNSFGMEGSYVNDQGYYTPSAGLNFATDGSDDGTIYFDSPDFTTISLGALNQNYVTMTYHTTNSRAKRMIYVGEDCKIGKIVDGQLVAPHKCQKITALIEGVLVKDSSGNLVVDLDVLEDGNIQFITKEPPAKDAAQDVIDAEYPVFDINVQAQIQRVEGEIYASVWYIVTKTGVHSEGSVPA